MADYTTYIHRYNGRYNCFHTFVGVPALDHSRFMRPYNTGQWEREIRLNNLHEAIFSYRNTRIIKLRNPRAGRLPPLFQFESTFCSPRAILLPLHFAIYILNRDDPLYQVENCVSCMKIYTQTYMKRRKRHPDIWMRG